MGGREKRMVRRREKKSWSPSNVKLDEIMFEFKLFRLEWRGVSRAEAAEAQPTDEKKKKGEKSDSNVTQRWRFVRAAQMTLNALHQWLFDQAGRFVTHRVLMVMLAR